MIYSLSTHIVSFSSAVIFLGVYLSLPLRLVRMEMSASTVYAPALADRPLIDSGTGQLHCTGFARGLEDDSF